MRNLRGLPSMILGTEKILMPCLLLAPFPSGALHCMELACLRSTRTPGVHIACLSCPYLCRLALGFPKEQNDLNLSCLGREWTATTCTHFKPDHSLQKLKRKHIYYSSPTILLHLPCLQSLSKWGKFLKWKLYDKLWPSHKT